MPELFKGSVRSTQHARSIINHMIYFICLFILLLCLRVHIWKPEEDIGTPFSFTHCLVLWEKSFPEVETLHLSWATGQWAPRISLSLLLNPVFADLYGYAWFFFFMWGFEPISPFFHNKCSFLPLLLRNRFFSQPMYSNYSSLGLYPFLSTPRPCSSYPPFLSSVEKSGLLGDENKTQ